MAGHKAASRAIWASNTVLLALPALAAKGRNTDARQMVDERLRRPDPERDVGKDVRRRRATPQRSGLMDELADSLVTRPGQAETVRLAPDAPAGLGDRNSLAVEADNRLEQSRRDAGSDGRHELQLWPLEAHGS